MEDQAYPPKRPNMQHFGKLNHQRPINEWPFALNQESLDNLTRDAERKRVVERECERES